MAAVVHFITHPITLEHQEIEIQNTVQDDLLCTRQINSIILRIWPTEYKEVQAVKKRKIDVDIGIDIDLDMDIDIDYIDTD